MTVCLTTVTLNPEPVRSAFAVGSSWLRTSGTGVVAVEPRETLSVTVVPAPTLVPASGDWAITVLVGWFESTRLLATFRPAARSVERALA